MPEVNILLKGTNQASGAIRDTDNEIKNLDKDARATSGSGGGLTQLASLLGTGLKTAAIAAVAAIGAVGTAVAVTGTNFDNMKEQATIAFTTMLGSGERARAFLDDLQKFAASTPFEFPDLVTASQRLLAMGFAADRVKPLLTSVGDAVAGLGGNSEMIDRVTTALGQMQAKGKVSSEEMMQLTEAGIPAWQFLADAIGKSVPEAMDLVSGSAKKAAADQGLAWKTLSDGTLEAIPKMRSVAQAAKDSGLDVATAITAITDGMNAKFGGLMEKQSHTFGGLVSTLKDTFTQLSGQVMQPFFGLMTDGLQKIVDWTSSPSFTSGVATFTRAVDLAAQAAKAFFGDLFAGQSFVDSLTHALAILLPPNVFAIWEKFKGTVQYVFDVISGNIPILTALSDLWDKTWTLAQTVFKLATDYVVANLPAWMETLKGWSAAAWQWLVGVTPQVITQLTNWYNGISSYVTKNLPAWIETLKSWGVAAWQWIVDVMPPTLSRLADWYGAIEGAIVHALPGFIKMFIEWETAIFQWINDALPQAIDAITGFIRGLRGEGESNGNNQFANMASGWADKLWKWITDELIPQVKPAFTKFISTLLSLGQNLLTSLGGLAVELGKTLWQWIVDITPTAKQKLADWGGELWGWIQDNLPTWYDHLKEWANRAWQWIVDATPTAVKKLGEWAAALWGWITEHAPEWGNRLLEWAGLLWSWIIDTAWPKTKEQIAQWADNLYEWIDGKFTEWFPIFADMGGTLMDKISLGFRMALSDFQKWLNQNPFFSFLDTWLGIGFDDVITVTNEYGDKALYSYRDGLLEHIGDIQNAANQIGDATKKGLADSLDMHSPSRVMFNMGGDVAQGFLNGVAAYASQFAEAGSAIGNGIASGLRSSIDIVASQLSQALSLLNATFQGEVDTFARQAAAAAQAKYLDAVKAPIDASKALKDAGVDTSSGVIGYGPNGELILAGAGNSLPPGAPGYKPPVAPSPVAPTTTIGTISATPQNVKDIVAGISDFLAQTVNTSTLSGVFRGAANTNVGAPGEGYSLLQKAQDAIRSNMASLLGLPQIYGALDASGNLAALTKSLGSGSDLNKVASLLQSAVDFRTLANRYDAQDYYSSTGITDPRLGGISGPTNNFTIQLQGSSNASADILGIVQMLGSLYGSATP